MTWKYVGDGEFIPGVPARDLSDEEASEHGVEDSPLYERVTEKRRAKEDAEDE